MEELLQILFNVVLLGLFATALSIMYSVMQFLRKELSK